MGVIHPKRDNNFLVAQGCVYRRMAKPSVATTSGNDRGFNVPIYSAMTPESTAKATGLAVRLRFAFFQQKRALPGYVRARVAPAPFGLSANAKSN